MEFRPRSSKKKQYTNQKVGSFDNWLDDDEEWRDLAKSNQTSQKSSSFDTGKNDKNIELNVKLSLPKVQFDRIKKIRTGVSKKISRLRLSRKALVIVVVIALIVISTTAFVFFSKRSSKSTGVAIKNSDSKTTDLYEEKPTFKILYPGSKNSENIGKIVKISPPNQPAAYTYIDSIAGVQINVTQQEIPDNLKNNQANELEKTAKSNNQTNLIQVDGVNVYSGQSVKGVQSLIFIKGNLLITIRSASKVSDEAWVAYISAMHS